MRAALVVGGAVLLLGCGGRSGLGTPPVPALDGGATVDARKDGPPRRDGPWLRDAPYWPDMRRPPDLMAKDSCLPIPASQVEGYYDGGWKGSWKCPGQPHTPVSGSLSFKLYAAGGPESFAIAGSMDGMVSPGIPFGSMIKGTMGCTSLNAQLPDILVGSGALMYKLTGTMVGAFQAVPQGFPSGQWKASEPNGACYASGSWYAKRLGP